MSFETGLSLELAGVVAGEPGCGVSEQEVTSHRSSGESEGLSMPSLVVDMILGSKRMI